MSHYEKLSSSHRKSRGSYDDYNHSDEELYVYDQCCGNCRFYDSTEYCCKHGFNGLRKTCDWCMDWKGIGGSGRGSCR